MTAVNRHLLDLLFFQTSPHLYRWWAGDGAVRPVWWRVSSAAVRLSLLSPAHRRPAGSWLRHMLSLSSSSAPVPALPPELPVGRQEPSVLSRRPSSPRLLLLPATHVRWTFSSWGPWLWYSMQRDRLHPWAAGGIQPVSVCLTSIICPPPISLPGVWQPAAPLSRPASPLSHTMTGKSKLSGTLNLICDRCWYLHQAWRNQYRSAFTSLCEERLDLLPVLENRLFCLNRLCKLRHLNPPSINSGMTSVNQNFWVLIMCLLTVDYCNLHQDNVIDLIYLIHTCESTVLVVTVAVSLQTNQMQVASSLFFLKQINDLQC